MTIIGLDFYGKEVFESPTSGVSSIYYGEIKNAVYDELSIREQTDVNTANVHDTWEPDHRAIFKFLGDLEGGNVQNSNLKIQSFSVKRRKLNETNAITLGLLNFVNNSTVQYTDYTQPNDEFIYIISPVAENGLEGNPTEVQIKSDFTGWWVIDKESGDVLGFDKSIDSVDQVETTLTQGRKVIETMSKFPTIYYSPVEYHTFTLSTVIVPSEFERSGKNYEDILNKFIRNRVPRIVKSSDGRVFICDISNPRLSTPLNTWKNYDYGTLSLDFTEIEDYNTFMQR